MFKYFYSSCLLLFSLLFLPLQSCIALQTVVIGDNQTKNITISTHELSRIFVKGDRILNVRGVEGAYILTKDAVQGQIFIKPTLPYQTRPFNLFIGTEQGRNYNLFVIATGAPGQDIELKPSTPSKEATLWERTSDYSQVLTKLITSMISGEDSVPTGYSIVYPDKKKNKLVKYDNFTIKLQKQYRGTKMYGEAFLIQNIRNYPVNLTEKMFYQEGTRAITLLNTALPAKGQTMLFRVMSEAGNE